MKNYRNRRVKRIKSVKRRNNNNSKKGETKKLPEFVYNKLAFIKRLIRLALIFLVMYIYIIQNENLIDYNHKILSQQRYDTRYIPYRRGDILDRNNTLLASSNKVYNLIIDASQINFDQEKYLEPTINLLSENLGYDKEELRQIIMEKSDNQYIKYAKGLSYDQKINFEERRAQINKEYQKQKQSFRVHGVWFEESYQRIYPYNNLACNVIGFTASEDSEGIGGIEQEYNDILIGNKGKEYAYLNEESNLQRVIKEARDGHNIISTIDKKVQQIVEKHILAWEEEMGSNITACLIMNPNNGEILAMASSRDFNLNQPRDLSKYYDEAQLSVMTEEEKNEALNNIWSNFAVSSTFEPGSPSKIFTVATALEEGVIEGNESYHCDGHQVVGNWKIHCANRYGHGTLTVEESLMQSCNDAMMQMAFSVGKDNFSKFQKLFGFGSKTGIDLPGEADTSSLIYSLESMKAADLASNSFGQNYNCTMIELAAGFASVINGGMYYEPHVVKEIQTQDGEVIDTIEPKLVRETVSPATAEFLKQSMYRTVEQGTGTPAKVAGYDIGGKTGTSEKYPRGSKKYMLSFIGFAPVEKPELLCYVIVDEPNTEDQAHSYFASSLFSKIMSEVLVEMKIDTSEELKKSDEEHSISILDTDKVYETDEYISGEEGTFEEEVSIPAEEGQIESSDTEATVAETTSIRSSGVQNSAESSSSTEAIETQRESRTVPESRTDE